MISSRNGLLISCGLAGLVVAAFGKASTKRESGHWLRVVNDSNYDVSIDTTRIRRRGAYTYDVWYRTDHAVTHLYKGKPFNREVVESVLECGTLLFKIASVDMSLGTGSPVSQQRTGAGELGQQPWRHVEPETIEAVAAQATCDFVRRYASRR
jgi:hypothetical protein